MARRRRKKKSVRSHRRIRRTCKYCGHYHRPSVHRFHGRGSYARTH